MIFFHPGHSYSNSTLINHLGKFPTQKNFLKQIIYADFFCDLAKRMASCENVFLDLILRMKLVCFAVHLNYLLLIFCSFSFILSLVPIVSFCSYLILMSKRAHLIHKFVVFKGWLQPKTLELLFILFYRIKENFPHPGYQIFKNFPICLGFWICQRSEYSGVLNVPGFWICFWFWTC